jgi:iron complex outermembrane receptor protein
MSRRLSSSCQFLTSSTLVLALAAAPAVAAQAPAAEAEVNFNIEAGPLDAALMAFVTQSHVQLIYKADTVRGRRIAALRARLRPRDALARLLAGADIEAQDAGGGTIVLKRRGGPPSAAPAAPSPIAGPSPATMSADLASSTVVAGPATVRPAEAAGAPVLLSEIVVTGSLIHGPGAGASPIVAISREQIDASGRATLADLLADLPQNFSGTSTPVTSLTGADRVGTNSVVSQGVNLRGLGASATLVLVNGRRMAGTGLKGDFADVSAIPTAAVARVEVLLDGASALYGSDAVGGVVNVILRDDFDGAETRARLGGAAGGVGERQVGQTLGRTWTSGHVLVTYEYYHRDALGADKRPFTASADLRAFGGTDHRQVYSHPGNIMKVDPATGAVAPGWAIPAGQPGTGLTPSSFLAGQVNLENPRQQTDILPEQTRNSVYASLGQDLGERLELTAEARYSRREFAYASPGSVALITVNRANPFFVSPNGASSNQIAYDFTDELGPLRSTGLSESLGLSAGVEARLGQTWRAEAYGAYAQELNRRSNLGHLDTQFLKEALGTAADDPSTAFSAARDGYFNPYGDGAANSRAVLGFIGSGYVKTRYENQVSSFNVKADGTVLTLPGGPLKAAFGAQVRRERFQTRNISLVSKATPTTTTEGPYERTVSAGFLEVRIPLVGPDNAFPGVKRLELSAAGRIEHYDDVGTTRNPKFGLIWVPADDLTLRASYGTSFRAPALSEVFELQDVGPGILPYGASQKLVLLRVGGNPNLKPETARSWTAGFDYQPASAPGLKISGTWFDTRFTGQIAQPVSDDIFNALTNPIYMPFIRPVVPTNPADLALVKSLLAQSTSSNAGLFPADAYTAIVDARYLNTGGLEVRGLDLIARWSVPLGADRLDLTANATYLLDYRRQVTPTAPAVELAGTAGQPAKLRAQTQASWTHGDLSTSLALNYLGGAKTASGPSIDSWTTADLQLRWRPSATAGPLRGLELALSMRNLFDTDPPFYDAPQGVGFDPANADPLGRFTSVQFTKRW